MSDSALQGKIQKNKASNGDYLADALLDLCFFTSYKIEELLAMPPKRLNRLLDRLELWTKVRMKSAGCKI